MAKLPALQHVRSHVTEGISANESYRRYQATAHAEGLQGMRRQDYLRLHSQTRQVREQTGAAMDAPKDQPAGGLPIPVRNTVQARGFGHWVGIHQRTSGESDYIFTPFLIKANAPMTPAEAEQRAQAYLLEAPDEYNRVTLAVGYMGAEQFQPMER